MSNFFRTNNPTTIPEARLSGRTHAVAAAGALVAVGASNAVLSRLYEASEHPVDYATGQTAFSGQQVKEWYGAMQDTGTLDTYWATQFFDFVFIASVFAFAALAATAIARFNRLTKLAETPDSITRQLLLSFCWFLGIQATEQHGKQNKQCQRDASEPLQSKFQVSKRICHLLFDNFSRPPQSYGVLL